MRSFVNLLFARDDNSSEQNQLSAEDMKEMVWLGGAVLMSMGHGHLFCMVLQLEKCYWALSKKSEE